MKIIINTKKKQNKILNKNKVEKKNHGKKCIRKENDLFHNMNDHSITKKEIKSFNLCFSYVQTIEEKKI